jgi:hypothetical protein
MKIVNQNPAVVYISDNNDGTASVKYIRAANIIGSFTRRLY